MSFLEKMTKLPKKTKLQIGAAAALLVVIGIAAAVFGWRMQQEQTDLECLQMATIQQNIGDLIEFQEVELPEPIPPIAEQYDDFPEVDFEEQWEINEDVCAWIRISGTHVDYPILRRGDAKSLYDSYYPNVTIEGEEGLPGSIYIEPCNSSEFTDFNTVIYGHNMRVKTMFGDLHGYDNEEYFDEHPYVYIVTPNRSLVYRVASAVYFDDRHIMYTYEHFQEQEARKEYLEALNGNKDSRNKYREDVPITADDRIITMSTCVGGESNRRFLVTAVLIDEQEHKQEEPENEQEEPENEQEEPENEQEEQEEP